MPEIQYEMVPTGRLKVDPNYQRGEASSFKRIVKMGWDPVLAGALSVADRNGRRNGELYVFDGQQRLLAARSLGIREVLCVILEGSTPSREALAFAEINGPGRTSVTFAQRFRAWLEGGDPNAIAIAESAARAGVEIVSSEIGGRTAKKPNATRAVGALWMIYNDGSPRLLNDTLRILRTAWPDEARGLDAVPIYGIASFLFAYQAHPEYREKRLIERLSLTAPETMLRRAKSISEAGFSTGGGSSQQRRFNKAGPRLAILELYNQRLRNPLPEATLSDFKLLARGDNPWLNKE